jgi:hypothetical protein
MANFLFGIATYLVSKGWVVKGSCNGTTGAMDGVNRWTSASTVTTRGASTTNANSWIVLTDASGYDTLLSYVGSTDDVARLSVSFTGDFIAAGTPNQTPTSTTNEQVVLSGQSLINSTTSQDRLWTCWTSSDSKSFRIAIARAGVWTGCFWGVEEFTPNTFHASVTSMSTSFAWAFQTSGAVFMSATNCTAYQQNSRGGYARAVVSSTIRLCTLAFTTECIGGNIVNAVSQLGQDFAPELQGGTDYQLKRVGLYSTLTSARGKVGNVLDWWIGRTLSAGAVDGDTYGSLQFINVNETVWVWDGTTTPIMT